MGKIYCPRFSSDWGSMMLIESQGEYLLIDTYCKGNTHPRSVIRWIVGNKNSNNAKSLCLLIEMDGCRILNCGDATEWTLNQLVAQG